MAKTGIGSRFVNFIRGVFGRDQAARQEAAGPVSTGDFRNIYGNYMTHALGHNTLVDQLQVDNQLMHRYVDYERMDEYPELSTALNIYADDASITDYKEGHALWIECKDDGIRKDLNEVFWKKIRTDDYAWDVIRMLCKYGNQYSEILVSEKGVQGLNPLPGPSVRRIEDQYGDTKGFIQSFRGNFSITPQVIGDIKFDKGVGRDDTTGVVLFEPWRMVHMRLRMTRPRVMYGLGLLEPARWVWKRLILLEDAALVHRLSRAPSRFAFYIDVGKMSPKDAELYLDQVRQRFKKKKFVNPKTGKVDMRYNPLSVDEDFFLPVREGTREVVRADVLNTPQWTGVEDIEYFRSKMFAAIGVPKAYLGYDENMPSRATLSGEDVRFARSVLRVQREYRNGMRQVANVHLASIGIDPAYVDYSIKMGVPSSIFELAQLEVQNTRATLAMQMRDFVSNHWVLSKIFGFSDYEIEQVFKQKDDESKALMKQQGMVAGGEAGGGLEDQQQTREVITSYPGARTRATQIKVPTLYGTEQQLFDGNRDTERRLSGDMRRVISMLQEQRAQSSQFRNAMGLLNELRATMRAGQNQPSDPA